MMLSGGPATVLSSRGYNLSNNNHLNKSMLRVTEIAFTGYPVTQLARSRAFYEGVFHLKPSSVYEHGDKAWIEYDVGGSTFAISNFSEEWHPHRQGPSAAFEVEDFDQAIAALREAKATFYLEPMDSGVCRMAVVADPDGNSLIVHRRLPTPAS